MVSTDSVVYVSSEREVLPLAVCSWKSRSGRVLSQKSSAFGRLVGGRISCGTICRRTVVFDQNLKDKLVRGTMTEFVGVACGLLQEFLLRFRLGTDYVGGWLEQLAQARQLL